MSSFTTIQEATQKACERFDDIRVVENTKIECVLTGTRSLNDRLNKKYTSYVFTLTSGTDKWTLQKRFSGQFIPLFMPF